MAVLNTTSPTDWPEAPTEMPSNTVPSSRTRLAVSVTGFAYVGLQDTAEVRFAQSGGMGNQASGNDTGTAPATPARRDIPESEQVLQAVPSGRAARETGRGVQRATREDVAVGRPVDQFDPLASRRELHGVLAHDVAGTQARIARRRACGLRAARSE